MTKLEKINKIIKRNETDIRVIDLTNELGKGHGTLSKWIEDLEIETYSQINRTVMLTEEQANILRSYKPIPNFYRKGCGGGKEKNKTTVFKNHKRGLYHRLTEYGGLYGLENTDSLSVAGL